MPVPSQVATEGRALVEKSGRMPVCSSQSWRTAEIPAHVAQSVEHLLGKEEVDGSIPFVSTTTGAVILDCKSEERPSKAALFMKSSF